MEKKNNILNLIKKVIIDNEPNAQIYLYGSRVHGKARSDSDWDLLILVNKEIVTPDDEKRITWPLYDLEFEIGEVLSPMVYSVQDWYSKHKITPFFHSVMTEGKLL